MGGQGQPAGDICIPEQPIDKPLDSKVDVERGQPFVVSSAYSELDQGIEHGPNQQSGFPPDLARDLGHPTLIRLQLQDGVGLDKEGLDDPEEAVELCGSDPVSEEIEQLQPEAFAVSSAISGCQIPGRTGNNREDILRWPLSNLGTGGNDNPQPRIAFNEPPAIFARDHNC
jgi:hypothetical protein